jgi:CCR4-NOT transcription complex subunit 3
MEKFKAMEKELKTKAYSQAGLNQAEKTDPEEMHKEEIRQWISDQTDALATQIDALEAEQETLHLKKGRKNNKQKDERLAAIDHRIEKHKFHQLKLEIVLRMIDNGTLQPDEVEAIQDDVKYYIDENHETDFEENDYIYEDLHLEEGDVYGLGNDDDDSYASDSEGRSTPKEKDEKKEKEPIDGSGLPKLSTVGAGGKKSKILIK